MRSRLLGLAQRRPLSGYRLHLTGGPAASIAVGPFRLCGQAIIVGTDISKALLRLISLYFILPAN